MYFYRLCLDTSHCLYECAKVPILARQVLPLTGYIFEASYSMSATQANKI